MTGPRASGKPEVIISPLTFTRLCAKEPGQGAWGQGVWPKAENTSTEHLSYMAAPPQGQDEPQGAGAPFPNTPSFLSLPSLHSWREALQIPESWPETLSPLTRRPGTDLSIAHTVVSRPFSCFLSLDSRRQGHGPTFC